MTFGSKTGWDPIAGKLNNNERYRPARIAAMLAAVSEPEQDIETKR